jgi:hypothetical protein
MGFGSAASSSVGVNDAEASARFVPRHGEGVCITDETDVRQALICIGLHQRQKRQKLSK